MDLIHSLIDKLKNLPHRNSPNVLIQNSPQNPAPAINPLPSSTTQVINRPHPHFKWFKILILVLVLAMLPIVGFLAWQYLNPPKPKPIVKQPPPPTPTKPPTLGWPIYTDPRLEFTFLYPPEYFVDPPTDANNQRTSIIALNDSSKAPVVTFYSKGFTTLIREGDSTFNSSIKPTIELDFEDYVKRTVLANYDSKTSDAIINGFKIDSTFPYKNAYGIPGFGIYPVLRTIRIGQTTYDAIGPLYVLDISPYTSERALFIEPNYVRNNKQVNKTELDPIFRHIVDSVNFPKGADFTKGWKTYITSSYSVKYPPSWSVFKLPVTSEQGDCVNFSDIKNPTDIPEKIAPSGHKIISSCFYKGEAPATFPYTNDIGGNETIKELSINGFTGIRGQQTSALGVKEVVILKNSKDGYIILQNELGDLRDFDLLLGTFKFNQ